MPRTSLLALCIVAVSTGALAAQPRPPLEDWMPGDVIAFVKLDGPGEQLEAFLKSAWWRELRSSTLLALARRQDGVRATLERLGQLEREIGKSTAEFLDDFIGEGLLLGIRLSFPPEYLVLARSRSEASLARSMSSLKDATRARELELPEGEKSSHRGVLVERVGGEISLALLGDTFLASNSTEAVKTMIDLAKGEGRVGALSVSRVFAPALKRGEGPPPILQAAVRPNYVPGFVDALPVKSKSFPASVLGTGWLERLRGSELIYGELVLSASSLEGRLSVRAPGGVAEDLDEAEDGAPSPVAISEIFFPRAPGALEIAELERLNVLDLASVVHLRRDFARWWKDRESFLRSPGLGEAGRFSSAMDILFAGRSFQDEILPRLEEGLTIVTRRASFERLGATPRPELPAVAVIIRLKGAAAYRSQIAGALQSLALLLNADRLRRGELPAFVVGSERAGRIRVHTVSLPLRQEERGGTVGIEYNFTPSVAVLDSRLVLGSTRELVTDIARELDALEPAGGESPEERSVDLWRIRVTALEELLAVNRSVLAARLAKLEGVGRDEAELRLRALAQILALFEDFRLDCRRLESEIEVRMRAGASRKIRDAASRRR